MLFIPAIDNVIQNWLNFLQVHGLLFIQESIAVVTLALYFPSQS